MTAREYHAHWALKYCGVGLLCTITGLCIGRTRGALLLVLTGLWLALLAARHARLLK